MFPSIERKLILPPTLAGSTLRMVGEVDLTSLGTNGVPSEGVDLGEHWDCRDLRGVNVVAPDQSNAIVFPGWYFDKRDWQAGPNTRSRIQYLIGPFVDRNLAQFEEYGGDVVGFLPELYENDRSHISLNRRLFVYKFTTGKGGIATRYLNQVVGEGNRVPVVLDWVIGRDVFNSYSAPEAIDYSYMNTCDVWGVYRVAWQRMRDSVPILEDLQRVGPSLATELGFSNLSMWYEANRQTAEICSEALARTMFGNLGEKLRQLIAYVGLQPIDTQERLDIGTQSLASNVISSLNILEREYARLQESSGGSKEKLLEQLYCLANYVGVLEGRGGIEHALFRYFDSTEPWELKHTATKWSREHIAANWIGKDFWNRLTWHFNKDALSKFVVKLEQVSKWPGMQSRNFERDARILWESVVEDWEIETVAAHFNLSEGRVRDIVLGEKQSLESLASQVMGDQVGGKSLTEVFFKMVKVGYIRKSEKGIWKFVFNEPK